MVLLVHNFLGQLVDKSLGLITHHFVRLLVHTFLDSIVYKMLRQSSCF